MAGLAILKHTYDLSNEVLCERRLDSPYYQFFCGEKFFQHRLVFAPRSSLTRWRQRMGEPRQQNNFRGLLLCSNTSICSEDRSSIVGDLKQSSDKRN